MNSANGTQQTRCVIYTRKSSEEGLEQEFNSLHAQREACEAYIKSQAHEGWVLIDRQYDDGGFSGGNIKRPALVQLMDDIKSGEIDLIIVYKVDRLSRSLADFSNMVETFDQHDVSFVSITQQFNTSTSMGRLTLNVLLSFAQFEREVTGERIRDKVAASKKKGMWMGGYVPLGYDNVNKGLVVNIKQAETVRHIYNQYLKLGSVKSLKAKLDTDGVKSKVSKSGFGGNEFSRGALYAILKNPIYIGKIRHKDQLYDGNHEAILEKTQWEKAQELLNINRSATYQRTGAKEPSLLTGLLFDPEGTHFHPLTLARKAAAIAIILIRHLFNLSRFLKMQ
ncbi:MAG: recombinase family protein [Cycloclasticus sp.]|nr:recombinase family protein [Cycloclasticus sp.]